MQTKKQIIDMLEWICDDKACSKKERLPRWAKHHIKELIDDINSEEDVQ